MIPASLDILLISRDPLLRDLLILHLEQTGRWRVHVSVDGAITPGERPPLHVLIDFNSSEGLGIVFVQEFMGRWSECRCMVMAKMFSEALVRLLRRVRVSGLFSKASGPAALNHSLDVLANKGFYLCSDLERVWSNESPDNSRSLTCREVEILSMVASGMKSPEIGRRLDLSVKTVHNHRANMMRKVGVRNVAQLVNYAHQNDLVSQS